MGCKAPRSAAGESCFVVGENKRQTKTLWAWSELWSENLSLLHTSGITFNDCEQICKN